MIISMKSPDQHLVHCMRDSYDVYIGRGKDPHDGSIGKWGNPFSHKQGTIARYHVDDLDQAIEHYRIWIFRRLQDPTDDAITLETLAELDGKILGCWCAPRPCHGQVLVRAAAWARTELNQEDKLPERINQVRHSEQS